MSAMVTCSQCRSVVPQSDTTYSTQGTLLCQRCATAHAAHAQVERARDAAAEGLMFGNALTSVVNAAVVEHKAHHLHGEIAAAARSGPAPVSSTVACSRCRTVVLRSSTTLSLEGEALCPSCAASYDAASERKRLEGSLFIGFLWGFLLSFVGIGLVYLLDRKPAEKKGAIVGAAIAFGLFYVFVLPALEVAQR
jgi:hypothetical protein